MTTFLRQKTLCSGKTLCDYYTIGILIDWMCKKINFVDILAHYFSNLMGSRTHRWKIDGFPGTHDKGATVHCQIVHIHSGNDQFVCLQTDSLL